MFLILVHYAVIVSMMSTTSETSGIGFASLKTLHMLFHYCCCMYSIVAHIPAIHDNSSARSHSAFLYSKYIRECKDDGP